MVFRWVHASCQGLNSDEEVENAADEGFDCSLCRMHTMPTSGKSYKSLGPDMCNIIKNIYSCFFFFFHH